MVEDLAAILRAMEQGKKFELSELDRQKGLNEVLWGAVMIVVPMLALEAPFIGATPAALAAWCAGLGVLWVRAKLFGWVDPRDAKSRERVKSLTVMYLAIGFLLGLALSLLGWTQFWPALLVGLLAILIFTQDPARWGYIHLWTSVVLFCSALVALVTPEQSKFALLLAALLGSLTLLRGAFRAYEAGGDT